MRTLFVLVHIDGADVSILDIFQVLGKAREKANAKAIAALNKVINSPGFSGKVDLYEFILAVVDGKITVETIKHT